MSPAPPPVDHGLDSSRIEVVVGFGECGSELALDGGQIVGCVRSAAAPGRLTEIPQ